jgi:hypothetical protein
MKAFLKVLQVIGFIAGAFVYYKLQVLTGGWDFLWWYVPAAVLINIGAYAGQGLKYMKGE